jgi:hypothetical protein
MANLHLRFFDKQGDPLNFAYVGPTGSVNLDTSYLYYSTNSGSSPADGYISFDDINNGTVYLSTTDRTRGNLIPWAEEVLAAIIDGATIRVNLAVYPANDLSFRVRNVSISGTTITLTVDKILGSTIISNQNNIEMSTEYTNLPGGYFYGEMYFDPVSAGLYENQQIFIVQEFVVGSTGELGYPHTNATGPTAGNPLWRTRWANDTYGNTDVSEIIFTYQIVQNDPEISGEPSIINYQNIAIPVGQYSSDFYSIAYPGYLQTSTVDSSALSINVALNAPDVAAEVYERRLVVEDLSSGTPEKIVEILFYGQIIGEDSRLDVLTANLGRAFYQIDSDILRGHDPYEPLPNWIEINEKRKELMVAGEEIFPYIGAYKGLIGALQFFGYQDLRIKEYWLNLAYQKVKVNPLLENQMFLNRYDQSFMVNQSIQIADVLDNENSGKYRLEQTYGPDADGNYVLNVSGEDTLVPSRTYKKTSLFGLYYDLNKSTALEDEYGYPITEEAFVFSQEEILVKLFALKQRLKLTYLPLNARIVDITGEGVYFEVYNTRSWTDTMERNDIDSGFNLDIKANPSQGYIEDLRAFSLRTYPNSIQAPMNYSDVIDYNVSIVGPSGDAFSFSGATGQTDTFGSVPGYNPIIILEKGKTYNFTVVTTGYDFYLTTQSSLTQVNPLGVTNNGATGGTGGPVTINVNPQEQTVIYYYSSVNPTKLQGTMTIVSSPTSDLGNVSLPLDNLQNYNSPQNSAMLDAISNFYYLKENGQIKSLGDGTSDPIDYIDPATGLPYQNPIGMPVILETVLDIWVWDEMGVSWNSLKLPDFKTGDLVNVKTYQDPSGPFYGPTGPTGTTGGVGAQIIGTTGSYTDQIYQVRLSSDLSTTYLTSNLLTSTIQDLQLLNWDNIDFSTYNEVEWIIEKTATQPGTPYYFQKRGYIMDYNKLAHFLPYTGEYMVTCNVYDSFNFKNNIIKNSLIKVDPIQIEIDAWSRYRENEYYSWNQTVRDWDSYESIWEYPAEGKTYSELTQNLPPEILQFSTYGNNVQGTADMLVKVPINPQGASGSIVLQQNFYTITKAYSVWIPSLPGSPTSNQYGFAQIVTDQPHGFVDGSLIFITGSTPEINGAWDVLIPPGSTGNSFQIPVVLEPGSGIVAGSTTYIPGATATYIDPSYWTNQKVTGGGQIDILVNGRSIGATSAGASLQSTVNSIVEVVNSVYTQPDYFAGCTGPNSIPATLNILANTDSGNVGNGDVLTAVVTGSLEVISASPSLSGGATSGNQYISWNENYGSFPDENLRYWGYKNLNWDSIPTSTWDQAYAHGWYDFEYDNGWLGGFEIHSIKVGDNIKVSTGNETYPFPVGVTFAATGGVVGPTGYITLSGAVSELNSSTEPHISNFYYQVYPYGAGDLLTTAQPVQTSFTFFGATAGGYSSPPTVPGAPPPLIVSFTYATGP